MRTDLRRASANDKEKDITLDTNCACLIPFKMKILSCCQSTVSHSKCMMVPMFRRMLRETFSTRCHIVSEVKKLLSLPASKKNIPVSEKETQLRKTNANQVRDFRDKILRHNRAWVRSSGTHLPLGSASGDISV